MTDLDYQLRNPVWHSLKESHKRFVVEFNGVQFYEPEICTFGAFYDTTKTVIASNDYLKISNEFFFVSERQVPKINDNEVILERRIEGCQMVLNKIVDIEIAESIQLLDSKYIDEIYDLIWLVMPGYYKKRSFEMGKFFGIFRDGKLVSIAGQRMQSNLFIEVSAVVTHPDYTKNGLARQLTAFATKEIIKQNKIPILHTNKGNLAISLYKKLGYTMTRDMNWWLYRKSTHQ